MAGQAALVDIVHDFIVVHQRFRTLFDRFGDGLLHFEEVRHLVADSDSSVLFRLKERVHRRFRERDPDQPLRRGEALFDLAVGSLFHEALKFRENLYQLEVYGPKVRALRGEVVDGTDELLAEFEKILRAASDRLGESLRETETLLEQTRKQLLALLADAMNGPAEDAGLVARYLLSQRDQVEAVYPEGVDALLARVHGDVVGAYLAAIRSHLASAHFDVAADLIAQAKGLALEIEAGDARAGATRSSLGYLEAYGRGMKAFLDGNYLESVGQLSRWLEAPDLSPVHVDLVLAVMARLDSLVEGGSDALLGAARAIVTRLEARLPKSAIGDGRLALDRAARGQADASRGPLEDE